MLPSVLLATAFSMPIEVTVSSGTLEQFKLTPASSSGSAVPWRYAIEVWGDPPHLRNYPWNGRSLSLPTNLLPIPTPMLKEVNPEKPAPVTPRVSVEEQIKLYESLIVELKARVGSEEVIERLQRHVDELKAPGKKPK